MREDLKRGATKFRKFLLWTLGFVFFGILTHNNGPDSLSDNFKYPEGPVDTRRYSKAPYNYGDQPIKQLPPLDNTIRIKVVGGGGPGYRLYDADIDFEDLMYQLGIDPEEIKDFIGD